MTKERLEELIEQEGLIFDKYGNKIVLKNADVYFTVSQNRLVKMNKLPNFGIDHWELNEIFETKDRAEWALKTTAERTERFEPPMWEDLLEKDLYVFTFVKDGEVYDFICNNYLDKVDIRLEQRLVGYSSKPVTTCQFDGATKEDYEKACEIVRRLFKGERNDYH